jgi:hypothetical protein
VRRLIDGAMTVLITGRRDMPRDQYGAGAAFVAPQDQVALELGDAAQHRQHQAAMWTRTVSPRIAERERAAQGRRR